METAAQRRYDLGTHRSVPASSEVTYRWLAPGTRLATAWADELGFHHVGAPADYLAEFLSRMPQQVWQ
jgi:hypothetical protein